MKLQAFQDFLPIPQQRAYWDPLNSRCIILPFYIFRMLVCLLRTAQLQSTTEQLVWFSVFLHWINYHISRSFLVWTFCRNEILQNFGRISQKSMETVHFQKMSVPGSKVWILRSFNFRLSLNSEIILLFVYWCTKYNCVEITIAENVVSSSTFFA